MVDCRKTACKHLKGAVNCERAQQTPSGAGMFFEQLGGFYEFVDFRLVWGFRLFGLGHLPN